LNFEHLSLERPLLGMHILKKPVGRNFSSYSRFAGARQDFAPHRRELQAETDVVAKTADRVLRRSSGMLAVDQLG
jgi:hypothetical protein